MQQFSGRMVLVLALALTACGERTGPPTAAELSAALTPGMAASLQANGQFRLAQASSSELTDIQAKNLAVSYARTAGRQLQMSWESDRGTTIDTDALTACGRAFYSASAFAELPPTAGGSLRRLVSSKWLVALCGVDGSVQVSIAVPAIATHLQVVNGAITHVGSADFTSVGIPVKVGNLPLSPEEVADHVARITKRRIAEVPELILPPPPYVPQLAKWRIVLESPVTVTVAGKRFATAEVYYGFGDTWHSTGLLVGERRGVSYSLHDHEHGDQKPAILRTGYGDRYVPVTPEP